MTGIQITGQDEILKKLNKFTVDADKAVDKAVKKTTFAIQKIAIKNIQTESGIGRVYKRGKNIHIASPPGKPPNTDTGRLAGSISVMYDGGAVGWVYTNLNYGAWLEFGTEKIDPRPWLEPSSNEQGPIFFKELEAELEKQINDV